MVKSPSLSPSPATGLAIGISGAANRLQHRNHPPMSARWPPPPLNSNKQRWCCCSLSSVSLHLSVARVSVFVFLCLSVNLSLDHSISLSLFLFFCFLSFVRICTQEGRNSRSLVFFNFDQVKLINFQFHLSPLSFFSFTQLIIF